MLLGISVPSKWPDGGRLDAAHAEYTVVVDGVTVGTGSAAGPLDQHGLVRVRIPSRHAGYHASLLAFGPMPPGLKVRVGSSRCMFLLVAERC